MITDKDRQAAAYYNSLPKKRTGTGVLIFNKKGQLLVVKPTYLDRWLCPGGGLDESEAPLAGAIRECKEETGLEFDRWWPAYISYVSTFPDGQTDIVQFMFTTDPVDDEILSKLVLPSNEIEDAKFVDVDELPNIFSPMRAKVVTNYCRNRSGRQMMYMQDGEIIG